MPQPPQLLVLHGSHHGMKLERAISSPPPAPMPWPERIPKHLHFTVPATDCGLAPQQWDKYCAFSGGEPVAFLQREWLDRLNPEFELTVHNDTECEQFVRDFSASGGIGRNGSGSGSQDGLSSSSWEHDRDRRDAFTYWNRIPSGVIRSDFWRVIFLLERGGVYVDADVEPLAAMESFVRPGDAFVSSGSLYTQQTNFHLLIARPGEPALKATFHNMMRQFRTRSFSYWSWSGCKALWHALASLRTRGLSPPPPPPPPPGRGSSQPRHRDHLVPPAAAARSSPTSGSSSSNKLGDGFVTSEGRYRLLLEAKVLGWTTRRKATCERFGSALTASAGNVSAIRILFLNKYLFLPNASVANASRTTRWGRSVNLWDSDAELLLHRTVSTG